MNNQFDIYIHSNTAADYNTSDSIAIAEFQRIANEYRASENNGNRLRVHLILKNQALVNVLRRLSLEDVEGDNVELYSYTKEDLWSMEVLGVRLGSKPLLDRASIKMESNSVVHFVIFGVSTQAESLAIHTALIAHYPNYCRDNSLRTRITWVSDNIDDFICFKQRYSSLLDNSYRRNVMVAGNDVNVEYFTPKYVNERRDFVDIEWEFVECNSHTDIMSYKLNKWSHDEMQQLTIAFCYDDDSRNINEALGLSIKRNSFIPVLLRVNDDTSIKFINGSSTYKHLIPMGMTGTTPQNMEDYIRMGQYVNYAYCKMHNSNDDGDRVTVATELPSDEELQGLWCNPELTTSKRWSNIYNAFTLNSKMHSLGIIPNEWERMFAINEREIGMLAEVEHNRWCVEEMILGYTPTTLEEHNEILEDGKKREQYKSEFKHDDLRNYAELGIDDTGKPVNRYDIGLTRTLPLIAHADYIHKINNKQYFAIRYRSDDGIHKKGDIQYVSQDVLHIGQTPECKLELPKHSDYVDICYAVIIKDESGFGWRIIRQDKDATIFVNGMPLEFVQNIRNNDRLTFDNTSVIFCIESGLAPANMYVKNSAPKWITYSFIAVFLILFGIVWSINENNKSIMSIYKNEINDIYKIEADSLLVLSQNKDTLDIISVDRLFVGTGFITNNGYFVTARHCVEFWLTMENELKENFYEIESDIVKRVIEAESDSSIRLVSTIKITSFDGAKTWRYTSDDFFMDKSRDNIYDCGNFNKGYQWRSVVSLFEKRDAELGDVAIMKWSDGIGEIVLDQSQTVYNAESELCSFGYPQDENSQRATFAVDEGKVYQTKESIDDCFICTKGFDQGFSGGPVFLKRDKNVVGIVCRSSANHTLIVPVSQIHSLINAIQEK